MMRLRLGPLVFVTFAAIVTPARAQEHEILAALVEGTHEAGYAPDFVLYSDGTVLRWDYEVGVGGAFVTLQLSPSAANALWNQLRPSLGFLALKSFYRLAEGWDYPEHRLYVKNGDTAKAVWVYGWGLGSQGAVPPAEFSRRVDVIKKLESEARGKWTITDVRWPPLESVWNSAFIAIREEQQRPWVLEQLVWILVTVLGLFVAAAGSTAMVRLREPPLAFSGAPARLRAQLSLAISGAVLAVVGLVAMFR
jgi:hypothetical protein